MTETWYILEDGEPGDPARIAPDDKGILRHEDGRAVAYGPHGPKSRGCVDAEKERAKYETRDSKAKKGKGGGYETRDSKAG